MIKFKQFTKKINENLILSESVEDTEKLSHLEHAEDHVINAGEKGLHHAIRTLLGTHHVLAGNRSQVKLTTKYDGAPSLIFGYHPETKKFFVASKSAFNKTPKINYSHEDVDRNHGHAPGLADKLKTALTHLPKVTPKGRVFQGDVMYTKDNVKSDETHYHFKPNTIQYSVKKNSDTGRKISNAHIGIAVHTEYKGNSLADMKAHFGLDVSDFPEHKDAHIISVHNKFDPAKYTPKERMNFFKHIGAARKLGSGRNYDHLTDEHKMHTKTYINQTVRNGTMPSVEGLRKHIRNKYEAKKGLVKRDATKSKIENEAQKALAHVEKHKDAFHNTLQVHKHLQAAKHVLVGALAHHDEFEHSIEGKKTGPEGYVAILGNKPTKLVDRSASGFAAANLTAGGIRSMKNLNNTVTNNSTQSGKNVTRSIYTR